ncbi:hypothetical protein [Thalassobellus citreus]|uniref:hypothetical protein n=1 Tax=Thalassobellus citreus TaxID=3367752 RepID=UPI0037885D55
MEAKTPTKFPFQMELLNLLKELLPLHSVYAIGYNKEKKRQNVYLSPQSASSQKAVTYTLLSSHISPFPKD